MSQIIRERRLELGLTLEEVGNAVGVSKSTVLKWENGNIANMRRDKIAKLAKALYVTPAYLMGWEEEADTTGLPDDDAMRIAEELRNRPGMRMLFDATKKATDEDLIKVAEFIEMLRGRDD